MRWLPSFSILLARFTRNYSLADVTAVLDRALEIVAPSAGRASRARGAALCDELPPVPLDESLCEQAFLNLVQNAYEAMEDHGGTLRVELGRDVNEREGVRTRSGR